MIYRTQMSLFIKFHGEDWSSCCLVKDLQVLIRKKDKEKAKRRKRSFCVTVYKVDQ